MLARSFFFEIRSNGESLEHVRTLGDKFCLRHFGLKSRLSKLERVKIL